MVGKEIGKRLARSGPPLALVLCVAGGVAHLLSGPSVKQPPKPAVPQAPQLFDGPTLRGNPNAQVGIIEYSDFQCPYCAHFAATVLPGLVSKYIQTGRVALVFRNLPLEPIHPFAFVAAEVAMCSARQGRFWPLHDQLFATQALLDSSHPKRVAEGLDVKEPALGSCMAGSASTEVRADMESAKALGLTSTPSFLLGRVGGGRLMASSVLVGESSFDDLSRVIDRLLKSRP